MADLIEEEIRELVRVSEQKDKQKASIQQALDRLAERERLRAEHVRTLWELLEMIPAHITHLDLGDLPRRKPKEWHRQAVHVKRFGWFKKRWGFCCSYGMDFRWARFSEILQEFGFETIVRAITDALDARVRV